MSISSSSTDDEGPDHVPAPSWVTAAAGAAAGRPLEQIAVLDLLVLKELESQLARPDTARKFALDYIEIWEQRYVNLTKAISGQDRTTALDAAISLKIGSAMVGGLRLSRLAEDIENMIRAGCWDEGEPMLALISDLGRETVAQLRRSYLPAGHGAE